MDIYRHISQTGLWTRVLCPEPLEALLSALLPIAAERVLQPSGEDGRADVGAHKPLSILDLRLQLPAGPLTYQLRYAGPAGAPDAFRLAVALPQELGPVLGFVQALPGHALSPARRMQVADETWLEAVPGPDVMLRNAALFLVVRGQSGGTAEWLLSEKMDPPDGLVRLQVQPPTVLLGGSGIGLDFGPDDGAASGLWIDTSDQASPGGRTVVDGVEIDTPADNPAWHGLAARKLQLLLPRGVPFIGGHAVDAYLQVGLAPTGGIDLLVHSQVPANGDRPALDVRIECRDPTAQGVAGFVPTLVEVVMELPWPREQPAEGAVPSIQLGGGKPVRARARFVRDSRLASGQPPRMLVSLALESQGADGLLKVDGRNGGMGEKVVVTAATLATALAADGKGPALHSLLTAAVGLSSFLKSGQVVLHRVELLSEGGEAPVGGPVKLRLDYSVDAVVQGLDIGVLSVAMKPNQPLQIRVRDVVLSVFPDRSGLAMLDLDFAAGSMEVKDPGGWRVQGLDKLFDVLGTRSGRGSMWIEVDLKFRVDLGPVKVSGATIRATLDAQGRLKAELRGLAADVNLAPLVQGKGGVQLTPEGFYARLGVHLPALGGLGAAASVEVSGRMVALNLAVTFAGPLPLANSGLGLYALGGAAVINGRPSLPVRDDPIEAQLAWDPSLQGAFGPSDDITIGAEAVIATLADLGFTFSARAGVFLTLPNVAVRAAVEGRYLSSRVTLPRSPAADAGARLLGVVVVDPQDAVLLAIEGRYDIPKLLSVVVPVAARFPTVNDKSDWFIHVGADGWNPNPAAGQRDEYRGRGPVRAVFLPGLINQQVDAYLMFRGRGITAWPRGGHDALGPPITLNEGFVCAMGVGFNVVWGFKPVVWVEISARADALFTVAPLMVVAMGRLGGSLHVGPFSVGVEARLRADLVQGLDPSLHARVCGRIDLVFTEIERCVELRIHNPPLRKLPPLPQSPLSEQAVLADEGYAHVPESKGPDARRPYMHASREDAVAAPPVWPDCVPLLSFAWAPELALDPACAFHQHGHLYPEGLRAVPIGSDLLQYSARLVDVRLVDCTNPAAEVPLAGPLSCAWLLPKAGDAGKVAQPAELALLTPHSELWLSALADAGAQLQDDPLHQHTQICTLRAHARRGYAWGSLAAFNGPQQLRLPPRSLSADATVSRFDADLSTLCMGSLLPSGPLSDDRLREADLPLTVRPAHIIDLPAPLVLAGESVAAAEQALQVPGVDWPEGLTAAVGAAHRQPPALVARLQPTFALTEARVWLLVQPQPEQPGMAASLRVIGDNGQNWVPLPHSQDLGDGRWLQCWAAPEGVRTLWVDLIHRLGPPLAVITLSGLTDAALRAAELRNIGAAQAAARAAQAHANGPETKAGLTGSSKHVLEPGHIYRVDVDLQWSGSLSEIDESGQKKLLEAASNVPLPTRSFWFRTAPALLPTPAVLGEVGSRQFALSVSTRRDGFSPVMLRRFVRGMRPAQSELNRFAVDPVDVHIGVSHAAALADAYGWNLGAEARRADLPASAGAAAAVKRPKLTFHWPSNTGFMTQGEAALFAAVANSPCTLAPPGGAVARAAPKLDTGCWYDFSLVARRKSGAGASQKITLVSFRTSRWRDAPALLEGLGFGRLLPGNSQGDLAVPGASHAAAAAWPLPARGLFESADDAEFDAALAALGLDGRPEVSAPRLTQLWCRRAGLDPQGWLCCGLLLESPEPVHRPGRLELQSVDLLMGAAGAGVRFDSIWRDRSGSRIVLGTTTPFAPVTTRQGVVFRGPRLRLRMQDLRVGAAARSLQGWLWLREAPLFAGELQ